MTANSVPLAFALTTLLTGIAAAHDPNTTPVDHQTYNIWTTEGLTGEWNGLRPKLEDAGIDVTPYLGFTYQANFRGGANTHNSLESAGYFLLDTTLDFEKMGLLTGASLYLHPIQTWNSGVGTDVGSMSHPYWVIGSFDDREFDLLKWWFKQLLFDERIEFRFGKICSFVDYFDKNKYADNPLNKFGNQALNYNQAIPIKLGLAAFLRIWPTEWLYIQAAAMDPDHDHDFNRHGLAGFDTTFHGPAHFNAYAEAGFLSHLLLNKHNLPGQYRFGTWLDPQSKDVYVNTSAGEQPRTRSGDMGYYFNFDQRIWKENDKPDDEQGLGIFARYGWAPEDTNRISHFWSVGAAWQGLIPTRDKDVLAFGVAQSILSADYRRFVNKLADRETVYELYYALKITPWCTITPDLQLITNPNGHRDSRDALLGALRIKIEF